MENLNVSDKRVEERSAPEAPVMESSEKVVFPPAATWYKTNATSSRDDMWAYIATQSIVLVKPKVTLTRLINPEAIVEEGPPRDGCADRDVVWPEFKVFGYQREHYNCISFCQAPWDFLPVKGSPLVTGCKEGNVRIWDVTTGDCVLYYDLHKSNEKSTAVACLDWSAQDPKVIYSMDEEGTLVSFYIPKAKLKSISFGKLVPTSLHASPHEANIVAFGTKGGIIYIAQTDPKGKSNARILHKMRHDEEIVATLWCPKLGWRMNPAEASNLTGITGSLLASSIQSVKPPSIRLWSRKAEDRGIFNVWERERHSKPFRNFSPLQWITDPNSGSPLLVTSSRQGQLIFYSQESNMSDLIHDIHQHSSIFGLVQCGDILWSTSYEPVIVGFNLRTMLVSCVIPTFKGVCSIAPCPSMGSLLAVGGVDACVRVIDFVSDYPRKNPVKSPYVSHRLRSKIMALSWHPKKDNLLGFGTDDGILGTFEVRENNKHTMQFDHRVSGVVYAVDWGPTIHAKDFQSREPVESTEKHHVSAFSLYACGGNAVYQIHPSKANNPLIHVSKIIAKTNPQSARFREFDSTAATIVSKASDIRWSPDFSLFAVGYNDGRVELYAPPFLQLKCWIKCHSRAIQFLTWRHNDFVQSQLTPDYKHRWFASTSNDATVRLFDLESIFEKEFLEDDNQEPKLLISSQAKLSSPSDLRMISCAWSPHDSNLLVTVSYDSTAIVWNITDGVNGVPIARYFGHGHRLVTCAFHPRNKYIVISASDECLSDSTLHVWDYRNHPYSDQLPNGPKHSGNKSSLHIKGKEQDDSKPNDEIDVDTIALKKSTMKDNGTRVHIVDSTVVKCFESRSHTSDKRTGGRTNTLLLSTANIFMNTKLSLETEISHLLRVSNKDLEQEVNGNSKKSNGKQSQLPDTNGKVDGTNNGGNIDGNVDKSMLHLGLIGNYSDCVDLMKAECESHASKGTWEKGCLLASWIGDTDFVERAIDEDHVSETIVNLAKSMSKTVYKKACQKYAERLVLQDDITKAATYLIQGGWKEEAVDLLVEHKLFRDAIALLTTHPTRTEASKKVDIMNKWLKQLIQDGNFEVAAKLYCSMGQYHDALTVIEKRDQPYAWRAGILLADRCSDEKKLKLLGLTYCVHNIMIGCHEEAKEISLQYKSLNWLLPIVVIHQTIFNIANHLRDAAKPSEGNDTPMKVNFQEEIKRQLDLETLKAEGIVDILKETILVSIAQNKNDAQLILIRNLLMKLLEDSEGGDSAIVESDYMKLCDTWLLNQKEPYLYASFVNAYNSFSSS